MKITSPRTSGFTLVELLTVIAIIAVLMGLLFPTIGAVKESARKAQAKNDVTQLATAVRAYYTEYGRYPTDGTSDTEIDMTTLIPILQGTETTDPKLNPREIVFFEGKQDTSESGGRYGIQEDGDFLDPWSSTYKLEVDGDYDNQISNPTSVGPDTLRTGVIAYSTGKDGAVGGNDDVTSWD